ncbi:hypothetical protein LDENG_00103140 [Lucifuga dentata]|nr:hypothetical protein LDENG_00103140 [Lucifuga dentata]
MDSLQFLNAFISERLTAAAVEIFGAVEKTLREYQGEISRSKEELDHLRTLVLWPEVRLRRSAVHRVIASCDEEEDSPERCHEEQQSTDVSQEHPNTLHIKEERDRGGASWTHKSDPTGCPQFVNKECREDSNARSSLYKTTTVQQSSVSAGEDIKAEPDAGGFATSPSTTEAEIPCDTNPEHSGLQRENLKGALEIAHHEEDGPNEQQYTEHDWSSCQDCEDPDPQIKVEKLMSSSPVEEADDEHKLLLQSDKRVYDETHFSSPCQDQTVSYRTFYEMTGDHDGEGYELSGPTRVPWPFCAVKPEYFEAQREYGDNTEHVENGELTKVLLLKAPRPKKRPNSILHTEGRESICTDDGVNNLSRERRHKCPICAKRFKESRHLRDHLRIHTGEKPYQCKECGLNFRQSGALTLHRRTHTGEKPFQCSDCGRRFSRKGDMETHRVTHTGERPHQCVACGKTFRRKSNLNVHLKTLHIVNSVNYSHPL